MNSNLVCINNGVGTPTIKIQLLKEKETVSAVLKRADIKIEHGYIATNGRKAITDIDIDTVRAGDFIVIAPTPSNG